MQDVAAEQERVTKGNADQEMLVVRDLVKVYPAKGRKAKPLAAVRGVSVGIKPQECFGLLVCTRAGFLLPHYVHLRVSVGIKPQECFELLVCTRPGKRSRLFYAAQHAFCRP
jgi:hypothetical protein